MNKSSDNMITHSNFKSLLDVNTCLGAGHVAHRIVNIPNMSCTSLLSPLAYQLKILMLSLAVWLCILPFFSLCTYAADSNNVALDIWVDTDTGTPIAPRETVNYKLYVENLAGEAWIRVHVSTSAENLNRTFGYEYINNADGWIRRGSYLYLTQKAQPASTILAIDSFTVPDTDRTSNATLNLSVWAEGIDTRAVTPDFSLDDPWKGHNPDTVKKLDEDDSSSNDKNNQPTVPNGSDNGSSGSGNTSSGSGSTSSSSGSSSSGSRTSSNSSRSGSSASSNTLNSYKAPVANAAASTGTWILADAEHKLWQYKSENGTLAKDGWYYIYNGSANNVGKTQWFYFNNSGYMQTGWTTMNSADWYHLNEISDGSLGALSTGWYKDIQDNKTYYLDNITGRMQSGWQTIGDKSYYFTQLSEIPGPSWIYTLISGTSFGRWLYRSLNTRSYGSMYINETTPDGSQVDLNGAKVIS